MRLQPLSDTKIVSILILLEMSLEDFPPSCSSLRGTSFNPYFVGDESGSIGELFQKPFHILFQSLFCWR